MTHLYVGSVDFHLQKGSFVQVATSSGWEFEPALRWSGMTIMCTFIMTTWQFPYRTLIEFFQTAHLET